MVASIIIPAALGLLVVFIVALVLGLKTEAERGENEMIHKVYIYLVLFATLMMSIGGSIGAFMALADLLTPAPYYQSFEDYVRWGPGRPHPEAVVEEGTALSREELQENYAAMVQAERERQGARAKNALLKSFGWIIIPLPVFIHFQRRLGREKKSTSG